MGEQTNIADAVAALEADDDYRLLRRIKSIKAWGLPGVLSPSRHGLFVDVETTGLNLDSDEIIEVALLPFEYEPETGQVLAVHAHDLQRQADGVFAFQTDVPIETDAGTVTAPILATGPGGRRAIIALSGPLTDDHPADPDIAAFRERGADIPILIENELVVRGNLPFATRDVRQKIGE